MKAVKGKKLFGGVHLRDRKALSCELPTEVLPEPSEVRISTQQSLGRPAIPCVEKGQKVKEGQLIARADGAISCNVHASVAGEVKDIVKMPSPAGTDETFIVIASDGSGEKSWLAPLKNPDAGQILARIAEAGIVGMGGAGFPAAVKDAPKCKVDTLLLNGAECEPYLTCDHRLMLEHTDEIIRGARYIAKVLGGAQIVIGIEKNKPDCIAAFEPYEDVKVVALAKRYPMGSEKHIIYSCTGRKVKVGQLPASEGVIVHNVGTAYAVCQAIELGKPLYEREMTVSGGAVAQPKNLWVRLGTSAEDIIKYCGGESTPPKKVVRGGPMTGAATADYKNYMNKTADGILLMTAKEADTLAPTACLNCGKCADVCPMHLMPMQTAFYSAAGDFETAAKLGNTMCCIECGACEYVCPARRPLIQAIRKTKAAMRAKQAEEVKKNG